MRRPLTRLWLWLSHDHAPATVEDYARMLETDLTCQDDNARGHGEFRVFHRDGLMVANEMRNELKKTLPVAYVQHQRARPIDQDCAARVIRQGRFPRRLREAERRRA